MKDSYLELTVDVTHTDGWGYQLKETDEGVIKITSWSECDTPREYDHSNSVEISSLLINDLIRGLRVLADSIEERDNAM